MEKLDQPMIQAIFKEMDYENFVTRDFIIIDPRFEQFNELMMFYAPSDTVITDESDLEEIMKELESTGVTLQYSLKKFKGDMEVKSVRLYNKMLHFISLKRWED